MTVEQRNFDFYDRHYRAGHPLWFLLHGVVSFDQRSKTRPNLALLEPALRAQTDTARKLRVLDYGSGFGGLLLALPRAGCELYAYDLSERAVVQLQAAAKYLGRTVRAFDPARDVTACFDVIVCSHVLEHVPSDSALLERFAAALRHSGLLLLNVPINELWDDPKHARRYSEPVVRALLERHGFSVLHTRQVDRVSAWLCSHEQQAGQRTTVRAALRLVRLVLGQLPVTWLDALEQRYLLHLPTQQLLVLARKV
jgi:2-polyprenyl-3-methyl-5-hydroxy-6-metoxy-1,4-benzoquinol methylase